MAGSKWRSLEERRAAYEEKEAAARARAARMEALKDPRLDVIGTPEACQLLMLTRSRLDQLVTDGVLERHGKGEWSRIGIVHGYIKYLREDARRANRMQVDSRVREARAREIETRTAIRLGKMVPLEIYEEMLNGVAGLCRAEFAGLPAAATRDIMMRRIIEREVNARLRRISEHAMAQAIRLETVRPAHDAIGTDGAGPVGGAEPDLPADVGDSGAEGSLFDAIRG